MAYLYTYKTLVLSYTTLFIHTFENRTKKTITLDKHVKSNLIVRGKSVSRFDNRFMQNMKHAHQKYEPQKVQINQQEQFSDVRTNY